MTESASAYNPEFDPTGIEGGVDTNILPWLPVPGLSGVAVKPLRASMESGLFSVVMKINSGARLPSSVFLGGMDLMVLSGKVTYSDGDSTSVLEPGVWGYVSANTRIAEMVAAEDSELLMNFLVNLKKYHLFSSEAHHLKLAEYHLNVLGLLKYTHHCQKIFYFLKELMR